MYTQEQVTNLQAKLDSLRIVKNRFEALQSMTWLQIDFGYNASNSKCCDLPINNNTAIKIKELLIAEYTSRVKALQDEVENTMIINPLKF